MKHWKQAFWLAKFELTASPLHLLALYILGPLLILFFTFIGVSTELTNYLNKNYVGFDLMFVIIFSIAPAWLRARSFNVQKMSSDGELWASPTLAMQLQLPIPKEALIKSRFVIYFFYSFPLQCIFLFAIYIMTPAIQSMMTPSTYLVFCIIWLSFGIYAGYIMPASDVGDHVNVKTMIWSTIGLLFGTITLLTFFILIIRHGVIYTTIILAQKWPLLSIGGSMILTVLGLTYWQYYMRKKIDATDYL